jgi:cell division protein FtsQ
MERSFAPGSGRPLASAGVRRRIGSRGGSAASGRAQGLWRPAAAAVGWLRAGLVLVWLRRRLRIALLSSLLVLALLAGGWLWLRDSSLVAVRHVRVTGVHGPDAHAIEAALTAATHGMSTMDLKPGALRAAVAPFRVVREVRTSSSFPHGLRIHVIEQLPVAALTVGGQRTAVAADGVVLGPALLSGSLPALSGDAAATLTGQHLHGAAFLAALTVLGAAPAPLAKAVSRAYTGPEGLTVAMRNGLLVYFGDGTLPHAKWLSLARVLSDQSSAGAAYVDVRLPERPAAGFAGEASAQAGAAGAEPGSVSDPGTAAELAAGLNSAVGGSSGAPTGTAGGASEEASSQAGSAGAATSTPAESAPETPTEAAPSTPAAGG